MGLFDLFRRPLTSEKFAALFMRELRRAGVAGELRYELAADRIVCGTGKDAQVINLINFFKEYVALTRPRRRQHLIERARIFATKQDDLPDEFEEARKHLRPKLWVRAALEKTCLQAQVDGDDASKLDMPEYEVGSHLVASLVYDLPQSMRSISKENLSKWGVTYYEALEIARENLEESPFAYAEIGKGSYAFASGDSYDACRLLLPSRIEQLGVTGDLIAMVPNRDSLLVTGSEDLAGLTVMMELAKKALEEPRPMVPIPLRREGDEWVDWLPEPGHPLSASFRELARHFLWQEYAEQTELLDRLNEKEGVDIFVASFLGSKKKEDGSSFSFAVWVEGVKTLLPKAEWIFFGRGKDETVAVARWEQVEQVVGHLMQPTEYYPQRWLLDDFPSEAELERLGKSEPE